MNKTIYGTVVLPLLFGASIGTASDKNKIAERPLWGDAHLHTNMSTDAGLANNRLPPETAYRFARGEKVETSLGLKAQLSRPLDWLVIADHTDGLGMIGDITEGDEEVLQFEQAQGWSKALKAGGQEATDAKTDLIKTFASGKIEPELIALYSPGTEKFKSIWEEAVAAAEAHNEPGRFTAMLGYEWTSLIFGNNMHRVVVMRDGPEKALQFEPYTTTPPKGSPDPTELWAFMENYEKVTGGQILAIPHNGNLSNGIMFPTDERFNGKPVDKEYAMARAKYEPLYEVTQIKGDGEAHPFLSPDDEFADFETWDLFNLAGSELKKDEMFAGEYAREAFKNGLLLEEKIGANPYKFGLIGATDSHTSMSTAAENNFFGKNSVDEPSKARVTMKLKELGGRTLMNWHTSASGLTGVWAPENNRESIFDAMKRKEVYATTGSRITLRVFGGWEYSDADLKGSDMAKNGYAKGVPMGADLPPMPDKAKAPTFMIAAMRDSEAGNLDRIQVIKGWQDGKGSAKEKVYNVAWSKGRELKKDGTLDPVGNTVNVEKATWKNTIGATELATVWKDPDFDPSQRAFYYVRVLEIPTPRWTTYDAERFKTEIPEGVPTTVQDRAYSSPIWYQPL